MAKLAKEAASLAAAGEKRPIFLCFTCDPLPKGHTAAQLTTRAMLHELLSVGLRVRLLSKGGIFPAWMHDLGMTYGSWLSFGQSLTYIDETERGKHEPGTAPTGERIRALSIARLFGLATWASLEPVVDPVRLGAEIAAWPRGNFPASRINIGGPANHWKDAPKVTPAEMAELVRVCKQAIKVVGIKRDCYNLLASGGLEAAADRCERLWEVGT
jgi:hypothetical protein